MQTIVRFQPFRAISKTAGEIAGVLAERLVISAEEPQLN